MGGKAIGVKSSVSMATKVSHCLSGLRKKNRSGGWNEIYNLAECALQSGNVHIWCTLAVCIYELPNMPITCLAVPINAA